MPVPQARSLVDLSANAVGYGDRPVLRRGGLDPPGRAQQRVIGVIPGLRWVAVPISTPSILHVRRWAFAPLIVQPPVPDQPRIWLIGERACQ
jgi:hypothetical protein